MRKMIYQDGKQIYSELTDQQIGSESKQEEPAAEFTLDERVGALETTINDMILLMAELIGGE